MESTHGKLIDELAEAEKLWQVADHLIYVTLPVVRDSKLMVRALENLYKSISKNISVVLKFEYLYGRVRLSDNSKKNLDVFFSKCSGRYGLDENDGEMIRQLMNLGKKHKESGFEFTRYGKIIILDDNLRSVEINAEKLKVFIKVGRKLLENTNRNFSSVFRKV